MIYKSLFILGRLPGLGRAELESLYGAGRVEPVGERAMGADVPLDQVVFARLGGSVRLAKPLVDLPGTSWPDIHRTLMATLPGLVSGLPEGKLKLGLSAIGLPVNKQALLRTGLELKRACKEAGRSARVVPSEEAELSSAQVIHNQLTGELGVELLCIRHGSKTVLARTVAVQDITAYARRDQGRPKRDSRVGMLPPKLAQNIVNLAISSVPPSGETIVLDPFCGTGVILQESLLMGYGAYGSDLEPRMVDYTDHNLEWLGAKGDDPVLEEGDATSHHWKHPFSVVASETYLGRPLSSWPSADTLQDIIKTCNLITKKFLENIYGQIPAGTRLCLAVPAWRGPGGSLHHLPLLDHLGDMGYNRVSFEHVRNDELVYYRPEQLVARELLVITRN